MGHADSTVSFCDASALRPGLVLPIARYRLRFSMPQGLKLPEYAGSLLRGQFGAALRRTACMTGAKTCPGCPLVRTCPYPAIFETPAPESHPLQRFSQVPNPYVIEPPPFGTRWVAAGDCLEFGVVLMGRALGQLPLVAYALQRAFRHGVGSERFVGELEDIVWERDDAAQSVWDAEGGSILSHVPGVEVPHLPGVRHARLAIATPLRLQSQGRPLGPDAVTPRRLLTTLLRRASLLFEMHADWPGIVGDAAALARRAEALTESRDLRWREWTRFSSRQQLEMTLGGVVGDWRLEGDLGPLALWLWLGQWLHIGKNATMGMGRYSLTLA